MIHNKSQASVTKTIYTGLFVCLGLVIPYFTGHAAGISGTILLPMHFPILIAGMLLGPGYGAACGVITPLLSSLLTGMPSVWPTLPMMMCELTIYGIVTGVMRRRMKLPLYISLLTAMIAGRIINGAVYAVIMLPESMNAVLQIMIANVVTGLPGIVLQLLIIPGAVKLLENYVMAYNTQIKEIPKEGENKLNILETAKTEIRSGKVSCILIKDGKIIHRAKGNGVKPLLELIKTENGREMLKGALVVDKITGKAAAMILVLGEAKEAYAITMSESGKAYLEEHHIQVGYDRCVEVISDRKRQGICPIERSVLEISDPQEGIERIYKTIEALMNKIS